MVFRKRSSKRRISAKHVTVCYLVVLIPLLLMPMLLFYNGYTFLDTETPSFPRHINKTLQQAQLQSPEPLEKIQFCAEKCRYVKEMCTTNKYRDTLQLPAPTICKCQTDDVFRMGYGDIHLFLSPIGIRLCLCH